MTMQSGTILRQYIDILNEAPEPIAPTASNVKVPPIPKLPAQDGDQGGGSVVNTNSDGTRSYAGAFGRFTYDKSGKAIKYASPQLTSVGREVDLASGDLTTNYNAGPMSASQTTTPGGYTKQSDMQVDLGTATLGQKTVGPDIAAGQLAGTTTNTVTNNQTGQAVQQVQGVGFGGASGANVGKNYVGASTDDLAQHAANSTVGINPDDAATTPQARVAPAVSPTAPKTEKDVVDLNAKYNKKKPASEDMARLRELSGIKKEASPTPTQQQVDQLDAAGNQAAQGVEKFGQGNYASGTMDVAKGMNNMANAAGMGFLDKLKMGWMFGKAGIRGLIAGSSGGAKAAGTAAAASIAGEVLPDVYKYVNGPKYAQEFEAGIMKMKDSPDPKNKEMHQKYMSGELTADSFKGMINRQYAAYQDMLKNPATAQGFDSDDTEYTTPSAPMNTSNYSAKPQPVSETQNSNIKIPASESMSAGVRMQRALQREKEKRERSERYAEKNFPIGKKPEPQKEVKENKSFLEHIENIENDGPLTSGDYFHIELSEDEGIETWVIAEWSDSVLIEADGATLRLLEESGITFQDELTEAEYQGRSVPLGKRMAGDVKKSKVYVKKPNGKVVKVNFGDKNMTIKKSNPARRRSFRARHNCANPGPRWKARYWSCRAW